MKANELRINNWVTSDKENAPTPFAINRKMMQYLCKHADWHLLEPIPLTEDWLVKFGFEEIVFDSEETGYGVEYEISISHGSKMVVCDDMSFGIENTELDIHWLSLDFDKFEGVHHLQNFYFALTGEELEINL